MIQLTPEEQAAYQDWSELDHEGNDDEEAVYQSCFAAGLSHARAESAKEIAALKAQIEKHSKTATPADYVVEQNNRLKAQVDGLRKDAERYKYLRIYGLGRAIMCVEEELDGVIDAAIAQEKSNDR